LSAIESKATIRGYWFAEEGRRNVSDVKVVVWQEDAVWVGYLQDYPDYWTQGESLEDLRTHLRDLYTDLSGGVIPGARRVEDLPVS
jgi:hypothetical protein